MERWIEKYPFLEVIAWGKIFHMVHYIVTEPYLESFQYKIINRLTNCNLNLYMENKKILQNMIFVN